MRPRYFWLTGGFVVVCAWALGVALLGGDPEGRPEQAAQRAPEQPAGEAGPTLGDPGAQPEPQPEPATPNTAPNPTPATNTPADAPEPAPPSAPEGDSPAGPAAAVHHDPLGTGAEPGAPSEAERDRMEYAAARYVHSAFAFEGGPGERAADRYMNVVSETIVAYDFFVAHVSPGGAEVQAFAEKVERDGTASEAKMESFELAGHDGREAEGTATFVVRSPAGESRYRQDLTLATGTGGGAYRVRYAQEVRPVEQGQPETEEER